MFDQVVQELLRHLSSGLVFTRHTHSAKAYHTLQISEESNSATEKLPDNQELVRSCGRLLSGAQRLEREHVGDEAAFQEFNLRGTRQVLRRSEQQNTVRSGKLGYTLGRFEGGFCSKLYQ